MKQETIEKKLKKLAVAIEALNTVTKRLSGRIDRLVEAVDKSKRVKGI